MMNSVIGVIDIIFRLLTIVVVVDVILSYFLSPYNNFRIFMDRIVNPMLAPIRRIVPPVQMIDFSPIILLVLLQVVEFILVRLLSSIG
jgi:YggT family protein